MSSGEIARVAIQKAIRALRKRHLLEEGAHAPAIAALARPFAAQGSEWKGKAEKLELELAQCYRAQSRLSEQLVVEVAECRSSKNALQEQESLVIRQQNEITQTREENSKLRESVHQNTQALDLTVKENQALRAQLEDALQKLKEAQADSKNLIDRWMLEKMNDAEKLNEVNALYEEMMQQVKISSIEQVARRQVDGVVRQREAGYDDFFPESPIPSSCKHVLQAHAGGCGSILFEPNSNRLLTGGQDRTVKIWDSNTGVLTDTLRGSVGSILDMAVTHDAKFVIGASSSNNLCVWESSSGRVRHTLTGHTDKVCGVDAASRNVISAAYDHTIKVWDLQKGYCVHTIVSISNCNAVAYGSDGTTVCSGHVDGNLRMWDGGSGRLIGEVAAHSQAITSICVSRSGNVVLTSGRDNVHNVWDLRTAEVCGRFRASGNRVASNWSRSCMSGDEGYVAAGSADGSVYVWSRKKAEAPARVLEGHAAPVLACSCSGIGGMLASADRNGSVCVWT